MPDHNFFQQAIFVFRTRYWKKCSNFIRKQWFLLCGMKIGAGTVLPKLYVTWPHQVSLGANCVLEHEINFKYDGIWAEGPSIVIEDGVFLGAGCEFNISGHIVIGKKSMIASGCKFIDHDHGSSLGMQMNDQPPIIKPILIEEGTWLGVNVVVLRGATIRKGAIVGAGSVVLKEIGENEIWAGVPAKFIRMRV